MREGQVLFTYLHLAASKECTDALLDRKVTGIAYETVQLPTARCRCSPRCPRSPAGSRRRSARTT
jgi:alanine dehydrogenase